MKKLIIRDHLGEIVLEADVFLEGQDFTHIEPVPKPIWVKEIYICDPDKLPAELREEEEVVAPEPEPEPEVVEYRDEPVRCVAEGCEWQGDLSETTDFGHDDWLCPACDRESLEEVKPDEPKDVSDKSAGDKGSGETKQSPSPPAASKKPAKRKATKRSS